jgi:hypothetical protein
MPGTPVNFNGINKEGALCIISAKKLGRIT